MTHAHTALSRRLSYVLRHNPASVGIELDEAGWVDINVLLDALAAAGMTVTRVELERVVRDSDKQRFALDNQTNRIRANQGHSLPVELGLSPVVPPSVLYHGTTSRSLASIATQGLTRGDRHHVHLSPDEATAQRVGARRGLPIVLAIAAAAMHADGHAFYLSANGVWLTEAVPPGYLTRDGEPLTRWAPSE